MCVCFRVYVCMHAEFAFSPFFLKLCVSAQACARAHLRCLISQHTEPSREVWSTMSDE